MKNWQSACLATAAMVVVGLWWAAILQYHYKADSTRLFMIGTMWKMPPELDTLWPVKVEGNGYDGQWYLLMAMDPFLHQRFDKTFDDARLRYRRILVSVLSHWLAGGRTAAVPLAMVTINLIFLGLGVYWCSCLACSLGRPYWWGIAFLLLPGTLTAIDRMGVDGALAALTMGFCFYVQQKSRWRLFLVLMLAALTRETGLLLIVAVAIACLCSKDWGKVIPACLAAAPALAWFAHVNSLTSPTTFTTEFQYPLSVFVRLFQNPESYPLSGVQLAVVRFADVTAILAFLGLLVLILVRFRPDPIGWAGALFALAALYLASCSSQTAFGEVFNYCRVFAPLFVIALAEAFRSGSWVAPVLTSVLSLRLGLFFVKPLYSLLKALL